MKIVGTIGLQRFYVEEEYQCLGIGKQLYSVLENYILNETNIKIVDLACGKILKNAHEFYKKRGFEQIENLQSEMRISEENDYFSKKLK